MSCCRASARLQSCAPAYPSLRNCGRSGAGACLRAFKFSMDFTATTRRLAPDDCAQHLLHLVTKRRSGQFAKRITTKKRIARRRKTARPSTSGAVLRLADQELINGALDNCLQHRSLGDCRYGILDLNSTDLKKLSTILIKLEDVKTNSSTIPR
jgi:hypothetical protein